jgi:hypothetical protein
MLGLRAKFWYSEPLKRIVASKTHSQSIVTQYAPPFATDTASLTKHKIESKNGFESSDQGNSANF